MSQRWLFPMAVVMATVLAGAVLAEPQTQTDDAAAKTNPARTDDAAKPAGKSKDGPKIPTLPGITINLKGKYIDVDGKICLDEGMLELIACTKGTKEHESIVAIDALAKHIHLALLMLGARPGHPPQWKHLKAQDRWVGLPAEGEAVDLSLVFKNKKGKQVDVPINQFITTEQGDKLPTHTFIFAGSRLSTTQDGRKHYLADVSGNVITISSFGDETLCLPELVSSSNDQLTWEVDGKDLPAVGTKVKLRLRPHLQPKAKAQAPADKASAAPSDECVDHPETSKSSPSDP